MQSGRGGSQGFSRGEARRVVAAPAQNGAGFASRLRNQSSVMGAAPAHAASTGIPVGGDAHAKKLRTRSGAVVMGLDLLSEDAAKIFDQFLLHRCYGEK